MRHYKTKAKLAKTFLFIVIGAAAVIFTDLLILDGERNVWSVTNDYFSKEAPVDVYALRSQHHLYMNDGVYIDPEMLASKRSKVDGIAIEAPPELSSIDELDVIVIEEAVVSLAAVTEIIRDIVEPNPDAAFEVANIAPAVGVDLGVVDEIAVVEPEEKEMSAVIYDLVVEEEPQAMPENIQYKEPEGRGMVVIIIDDMGISLRSRQVEVLPAPLTLAYLPYAENLAERTSRASANGHELMLHMPMEPMNGKLDGGPKVLRVAQNDDEFIETLEWGLSSFDGFVGLNNHMGSRLTKDEQAMERVMGHLKGKDMFFIDSKTIGSSVAARVAHENGIPYAERDVFIDHEITMEFIRNSLAKLEKVAAKKGYAIAIGHPHKETIAALKEWLPTLEGKGLTLVPASRVIKYPMSEIDAVASN